MNKIDILYQKWQSLQPLPERKQYLLSQRFTVDYNYNSNHIEGNTLTYGQTELLLLFGKVSGEGDLKDFNDMKASQVSLKMIEEEAKNLNMPLTETFIRQLHKTLLREDYEVHNQLPGGIQTSYTVHAGRYKTRPNSVRTRYGDYFEYASPEETPALMSDLVTWFNKEEACITSPPPKSFSARTARHTAERLAGSAECSDSSWYKSTLRARLPRLPACSRRYRGSAVCSEPAYR